MQKKENITESFSPEELQREADEIRALLENEPELQNLHVSDEMHNRLADRIRKYEQEKAVENLSEEDKEALRLGKELQNQRHKSRMPKNRKIWLLLAATFVLAIGISITGIGGKNIIVDVFERTFGGGDKTYVDSAEKSIPVAGITEEQAYTDIKEVFGKKIVQLSYIPDNAVFLDMQLDKELQEAILYYSVDEKTLSFRMVSRYVNSSIGVEIQDKMLQEYQIELPETIVQVSEYQIEESGELEYAAKFTYKNCEYFLTGITEKTEFEKIIKNLHFF